MPAQQDSQEFPDTSLSVQSFLFTILAMAVGMLAAVVVLPAWMPNLATSMLGPEVKAYWYLSRGTAFVALSLLWLSMALGLLMSSKMARTWPGAPLSFAIHEYVSLLGLGFSMFHAIVLMGDKYINFDLTQLAIPFASSYQPFWVGVGQLGFYMMLILSLSFYLRKAIGHKTWRTLHFMSFFTYLMALFHSLAAGTDTSLPWAQQYYWVTGGILIFILIYRILTSFTKKRVPARSLSSKVEA